MIVETTHVSERAAELKRSFDRSFAEVQHFGATATEDLLSIRVGGDPFMLRLAEIAGFFVDKKVTPLPSRVPELSGIAGFRGSMVPIYDLAALLGYSMSRSSRWIVLAAEAPIGLAFDLFEGHFRIAREAIALRDGADGGGHLRNVVRAEDVTRPIVNIPSIVDAIRARAPVAGKKQEI